MKWKTDKRRNQDGMGRNSNIDKVVKGLWWYFPLKAKPLRPSTDRTEQGNNFNIIEWMPETGQTDFGMKGGVHIMNSKTVDTYQS